MAETHRQKLTREQLDSGTIPFNHVLVEMMYSCEGMKSKGGVIIGVNIWDEFEDETTSHKADFTEIWGKVVKLPQGLLYDEKLGMQWDCDMELQENDLVWFNTIESFNAIEIDCEGKFYRLLPYSDIYVAKRKQEVIMLNGYVLLEPIYLENKSPLAVDMKGEVDKTRGIVKFVGKPNRSYVNKYVDFVDLRVGDTVLLQPNCPLFLLERKKYLSSFDGDNLYWVVQRRRISMVLKRD